MRWPINGTALAARCSDIAVRARAWSWRAKCVEQPAVMVVGLVGPPLDCREDGFRRVAGDLRHQVRQLRRVRRHVDPAVELVVQADRPLVVVCGIRRFQTVWIGRVPATAHR